MMPIGGQVVGIIFFSCLWVLGIDSAFSITESVLAGIVDKTGWRLIIVLPVLGHATWHFYRRAVKL